MKTGTSHFKHQRQEEEPAKGSPETTRPFLSGAGKNWLLEVEAED